MALQPGPLSVHGMHGPMYWDSLLSSIYPSSVAVRSGAPVAKAHAGMACLPCSFACNWTISKQSLLNSDCLFSRDQLWWTNVSTLWEHMTCKWKRM